MAELKRRIEHSTNFWKIYKLIYRRQSTFWHDSTKLLCLVLWCATRYQRIDLNKDAAFFGKKHVSAAMSPDLAPNSKPAFDTHHSRSGLDDSSSAFRQNKNFASFGKNLSLSLNCRSFRFCGNHSIHSSSSRSLSHTQYKQDISRFHRNQHPLCLKSHNCLKGSLISMPISYLLVPKLSETHWVQPAAPGIHPST